MDLTLQPLTDPPLDELVDHLVRRRFLGEQAGDADRAREAAEAMVERIRERTQVLDVVRPGGAVGAVGAVGAGGAEVTVVGRVFWIERGGDGSVLHLRLDDPTHAGAVRAVLEGLARAAGAARLTIGVFPDDPTTQAFVDDPGFEVAAVQMRLDLTRDLPAEDVVTLEPMDEPAFALWEADEVESYAEARVRSGESPEQALATSQEQHAQLLPDGLATEHHRFFVGRVGGDQVGTLWVGTERPIAFVYDVLVDEAHRRRGYGGGLMRAGALWAREQGAPALGLNVFGYNHGARALYDALGYDVVEVYHAKAL